MKKEAAEKKENKAAFVTVGLLAHVDAGKTTLAEALLFTAGKLRKVGRVDHQNAFLDTHDLEKQHGITIFSKQAQMRIGNLNITLLDTPGHIDFSPEMERTLQVLDACILVISAPDGVQSYVETLWRLLEIHGIPVFLFINKMDQEGCSKDGLLKEVKEHLNDACVDFSVKDAAFYESAATGSEEALEQYLKTGKVDADEIRRLASSRKIFPCFFGSALKLQGVGEFLAELETLITVPAYPEAFGARVFKIARDEHGERLTYLKVTGGTLKVRSLLPAEGDGRGEKINQIRMYDGNSYSLLEEAKAGCICALTGPQQTRCGDGFGYESNAAASQMIPILTYQVILPEGCDVHQAFRNLKMLEEEEPQLHVVRKEAVNEIHVQVMGGVQIEILKSLLKERFDLDAAFGAGSIIYKESICNTVEGAGHFEPLRHYAEVHLLLEPGERGSGMIFAAACSEDLLNRNWQRLILTHLSEKQHAGVLTGSELTDVKITLKSGRAHPKHTEGGDFRQATYRAVRQGLMQAQSVLLEPYYAFRLELPSEMIGRAMTDIQRMSGTFEPPLTKEDRTILTGRAPVSTMREYPMEVISYSHGQGRISCTMCGYDVCHNAEEVIAAAGYDPTADPENPADSVFCSHGSGYIVPWYEAPAHMHLEPVLKTSSAAAVPAAHANGKKSAGNASDNELKEIFERTYGSGTFSRSYAETAYTDTKRRRGMQEGTPLYRQTEYSIKSAPAEQKEQFLLVDGYNIIFSWDELNDLAQESAEAARGRLMDILCNYQGYKGMTLILVFDAYRVAGNPGKTFRYHNIHVVYTKEAETADQYIEKTVHRIGRKCDVTVATSDRLEQVIILGQGARRMPASELYTDVCEMAEELRREHLNRKPRSGRYLFDDLSPETARKLEEKRLGRQQDADG